MASSAQLNGREAVGWGAAVGPIATSTTTLLPS